ncbi:MAG: type pilus modification protein PilV [Pseudomonadota bacterium]|jgi:type IV pilus assembly protein PilV
MKRAHQPSAERRHLSAKYMTGASMIELLVAFLLLAFGILGLSGLQATALKNNQSTLQRSQASMLASYFMDAMRANRTAALNGDYNLGKVNLSGTNQTICEAPAGTTLVSNDHKNWFNAVKYALGDVNTTCVAIECNGNGNCSIAIEWEDTRVNISTQEQQTLTISSRL